MDTVPQSEASNDIFSLSDEVLLEHVHFIDEIGFGNWGSVWLCRLNPGVATGGSTRPGQKIAVKLVHRSKTSTTAARVRSLWNEMKIIKSLKSEPHPSIIPFHSFIITPSYALITMTYLPTLVPVEVEESKARDWFHFLLSGVEFLHVRGVVHNDIKPANILISHRNIPVLVDFGFAEKYDTSSDTAFHSNLSYGTPEYLSPERARGLPHDTRKSDIWSLGVTFFEILVGRTPFEKSDGEQLNTNGDLEKYWERTLRGKWVGTWEFSKGMEKLLQRMMSPNADLRCTAKQAMVDVYWQMHHKKDLSHKRASSCTSTVSSGLEKDLDKLLNMTPSSWKGYSAEVKNINSPDDASTPVTADQRSRSGLPKSKLQPRVAGSSKAVHGRKRALAPPVADLSPIKASPTASPAHVQRVHTQSNSSFSTSGKAKENISTFNKIAATVVATDLKKNARPPFGVLSQNNNGTNSRPTSMISKKPSGHSYGAKAIKVLGEMKVANTSGVSANYNIDASFISADRSKDSTNVKDRVKDWEREKERLREMERLDDMEKEWDGIYKRQKKEKRKQKEREREEAEKRRGKEDKREQEAEEETCPELFSVDHEDQPEKNTRFVNRKRVSQMHIRIPSLPTSLSRRPSINNETEAENQMQESRKMINKDCDLVKETIISSATSPVLPMFSTGPRLTQVFNISMDTPLSAPSSRPTKAKGSLKHSIKASIDKTIEFFQSASIASGRSTPARGLSFDVMRPLTKDNHGSGGKDGKEAWEFETGPSSSEIVSPLPVIKNAAENEKIAADARMDRKNFWMRNVEKVVDEAKENFASASASKELPLPPLPPPLSRTAPQNRSSRLPRRVLAASQIFQSDENGNITPMSDQSMLSNNNSTFLTANDIISPAPAVKAQTSAGPVDKDSEGPVEAKKIHRRIPEIHTPSRQRRATVAIGSPAEKPVDDGIETSPRKEKSKSQSNLDMHIVPISVLEAELNKTPPPKPTPRLSQVIDPKLFVAPPRGSSRDDLLDYQPNSEVRHTSFDELTASPFHVEPYPQRYSHDVPVLDTPSRHRLEGVYDRFLMATSGVKRVGKGYQSDHIAPVAANKSTMSGFGLSQNRVRGFHSTRRPMPPPVSSEDLLRMTASVDELGNWTSVDEMPEEAKEENVGFVRKAFKLMVPKAAAASKRLSRIG